MPEPNRPLKVFLCHAHADRDPVRGLYARLTQDGVDAWLDKAKLLPGQDWELEIRKAVREADVVVVCLSKQFNQAGFRQKEVRLALDTAMEKPEGEIFIIPARLEECDTLESLRKWHWVDLFEDDGYDKLAQALSLRAQQVNAYFARKYDLKAEPGNYVLIGQPAILSNLGIVHQKKGDFSKAIEYFESALLLSKGMEDRKAEATILSNLGSTYENRGDLVRAIEFYEKALRINDELEIALPPYSHVKDRERQIYENIIFTYQDMPSLSRSHGLRIMVENKNPQPIICKAFLITAYSTDESIRKYLLTNNFYWVDDSSSMVIERRIDKNRIGTFFLANINRDDPAHEYLFFVMQDKANELVKRFRGMGEYSLTCEIQGTMGDVEFTCPVIEIAFEVSLNKRNQRFIRTTRANIPKGD
jgi:tetratricopeptide (TPR) repeat protein